MMFTGTVIARARAENVSCLTKFLGGILIFRQVIVANFPIICFFRYARLIFCN